MRKTCLMLAANVFFSQCKSNLHSSMLASLRCFFFLVFFYLCSMRWEASMIRVDLPLLPLKPVVFVVVDVQCYSWSCNVTTACCYMLPNRKGIWCNAILQPKLMLLICFNPLTETSFMDLSESFFLIHLKHASYCRLGHPNLKAPSMQSSRYWFIFSHNNDSHLKKSLFERRQKL